MSNKTIYMFYLHIFVQKLAPELFGCVRSGDEAVPVHFAALRFENDSVWQVSRHLIMDVFTRAQAILGATIEKTLHGSREAIKDCLNPWESLLVTAKRKVLHGCPTVYTPTRIPR